MTPSLKSHAYIVLAKSVTIWHLTEKHPKLSGDKPQKTSQAETPHVSSPICTRPRRRVTQTATCWQDVPTKRLSHCHLYTRSHSVQTGGLSQRRPPTRPPSDIAPVVNPTPSQPGSGPYKGDISLPPHLKFQPIRLSNCPSKPRKSLECGTHSAKTYLGRPLVLT